MHINGTRKPYILTNDYFKWIVHKHCSHFTIRIIGPLLYQRVGNNSEVKYVFTLDITDDGVCDGITSGGRLFHV